MWIIQAEGKGRKQRQYQNVKQIAKRLKVKDRGQNAKGRQKQNTKDKMNVAKVDIKAE